MNKKRSVYLVLSDSRHIKLQSMLELRTGDEFILYEDTGECIGRFTAISDGYLLDGIGAIAVDHEQDA